MPWKEAKPTPYPLSQPQHHSNRLAGIQQQLTQSLHPPRPILDRLSQVRRPNVISASKVGDRARQLEHAVVAARRELQLPHRRLHQALARAVERAEAPHRGRSPVGVGQQARAAKALALAHPRAAVTRSRTAREGSPCRSAASFSYGTRDLDVDVDPVEQRAGDALLVARHHGARAGALLLAVAVVSA